MSTRQPQAPVQMWREVEGKMNMSQEKWVWGFGSSFKKIWAEVDPKEKKTEDMAMGMSEDDELNGVS